ncbi:enoyl-CoA hydratase-related protein [Sporichthya polymorpha]|uniref:enoyl-CoA hydratase-related protein n=1 Tax=Sporichthya polymorpha TaxID=35751 RepID=UPI000365F276|nr:enoyl-CoA hydratase-related protein [Sporichthya polymorpha]
MEPGDFAELDYAVADGVATVTLNRPERRNAWSGRMAVEYRWALHHADTHPAVRVVVLTGAGGDFCAGAHSESLNKISDGGGSYTPEKLPLPPYPEGAPDGMRRNHVVPLLISTPVIAAIRGACAGAGFVLATYADFRFAAADARITTSFARLGLPAEYGINWLLPRQIGVTNAAILLYTAAICDGNRARDLGWVQSVHAPDEVLPAAQEFATSLARHSSGESLRLMKRQLMVDAWGPLDEAYTRSVQDMNAALKHPDIRVGLRALKEKRLPDFLAE